MTLTQADSGGGNLPYETTVVLRKELIHELKGEVFEAGNHAFVLSLTKRTADVVDSSLRSFNFSFIIPSSADSSQRCTYGRTRYYVKATTEFDQMLSPSLSSSPVVCWLSPTPTAPGEIPPPMDWSIQHFSEELGPVGVGFSSPHLTVGSLANIRLSLLSPPQALTIVSIKGILKQQYTLHYADGSVVRPQESRYTLLKVDQRASPNLVIPIHNPATCQVSSLVSSPILPLPTVATPSQPSPGGLAVPLDEGYRPTSRCCQVEPDVPLPDLSPLARLNIGDEFHHSRVCRIPTDNLVRATTLPGSKARIGEQRRRSGDGRIGLISLPLAVVEHQLHIEVRYRKDGEDEDMVLSIGKPITITGW